MWSRVIELMLAAWLAVSPYVFDHDPESTLLWAADYGAALIVATLALLSFHRRLYRAHLGTLAVAALLIVLAFLVPEDPPPPAYQNYMGVGVLLLMFAIVPSECRKPPRRWREYVSGREERHASYSATPDRGSREE